MCPMLCVQLSCLCQWRLQVCAAIHAAGSRSCRSGGSSGSCLAVTIHVFHIMLECLLHIAIDMTIHMTIHRRFGSMATGELLQLEHCALDPVAGTGAVGRGENIGPAADKEEDVRQSTNEFALHMAHFQFAVR
eukprot:TRINITY_DN566_c0_g1_i2.p2 TRINITY_DN566_c0_g1~~TRINITY_DN566_c0_g1_i2.p2  ORF type:complete len:133 (+),score=17.25 TRINITY_DN566_c0_g1_i2:2648-3046(+)